ncbi:hypothetical protein TWF281_010586 [Arthrobotrys megalospora]
MSSAPAANPEVVSSQPSEAEPLLGRAGAASQRDDAPFWRNFFLGTGFLAQIGLLVLISTVWTSIFSLPFGLFTLHPLFNSISIWFIVESVLLLQPTRTPHQKVKGAIVHSILIGISLLLSAGAGVVIVLNKIRVKHAHFDSPHAVLGLIVYVLIVAQTVVGFAQFYTPRVFGSVEKAKAIYKYHRIAGYTIQLLLIATLLAASRTTFALGPLNLKTWKVAIGSVLVLLGIFPRIKKEKLGLRHR